MAILEYGSSSSNHSPDLLIRIGPACRPGDEGGENTTVLDGLVMGRDDAARIVEESITANTIKVVDRASSWSLGGGLSIMLALTELGIAELLDEDFNLFDPDYDLDDHTVRSIIDYGRSIGLTTKRSDEWIEDALKRNHKRHAHIMWC